jgi:hypothetical protein
VCILLGDSKSNFSTKTWKGEFSGSKPHGKNPNTGLVHPIQDQLGGWIRDESSVYMDDTRLSEVEMFNEYHKSAASITASGSPQTKSLPVMAVMWAWMPEKAKRISLGYERLRFE